jgi:hypothetical protein
MARRPTEIRGALLATSDPKDVPRAGTWGGDMGGWERSIGGATIPQGKVNALWLQSLTRTLQRVQQQVCDSCG